MPPRKFKWAIILCQYSDRPTPTRPREYYVDLFTQNGTGGLCDYWRDVTNNNFDLTDSQVFGWFAMSHATTEVAGLVFPGNRSTLVQWGKDTAAANGVNLASFDNVLVVQNYGVDHGAAGNGVVIVDPYPGLCEFGFISHEMGHGHGLPHSFSANPDFEYGDGWDVMSFATTTFQFNLSFRGASGAATVGMNARNLEALNAVPARRMWSPAAPDFSESIVLQPLNQQTIGNVGFLVGKILPVSTRPTRGNNSSYTLELRQKAGWDRSIPRHAVLVHEVRSNGSSYLPLMGLNLAAGEDFVTPDPRVFFRVAAIDPNGETATVRVWDLPDGSLRKEDSKPKVYLIENGTKRWVTSPQVLTAIGKTWADVRVVPDGGLSSLRDGPDVNVLRVGVTPYPVPLNRSVSVKFTTTDVTTGGAVAGKVKSDGVIIGDTNVTLRHTFRPRRVGHPPDVEQIPPVVTVAGPGFPDRVVDCGFEIP
jgi:hypothetical protein